MMMKREWKAAGSNACVRGRKGGREGGRGGQRNKEIEIEIRGWF